MVECAFNVTVTAGLGAACPRLRAHITITCARRSTVTAQAAAEAAAELIRLDTTANNSTLRQNRQRTTAEAVGDRACSLQRQSLEFARPVAAADRPRHMSVRLPTLWQGSPGRIPLITEVAVLCQQAHQTVRPRRAADQQVLLHAALRRPVGSVLCIAPADSVVSVHGHALSDGQQQVAPHDGLLQLPGHAQGEEAHVRGEHLPVQQALAHGGDVAVPITWCRRGGRCSHT